MQSLRYASSESLYVGTGALPAGIGPCAGSALHPERNSRAVRIKEIERFIAIIISHAVHK
jgi:hypothetical protein